MNRNVYKSIAKERKELADKIKNKKAFVLGGWELPQDTLYSVVNWNLFRLSLASISL